MMFGAAMNVTAFLFRTKYRREQGFLNQLDLQYVFGTENKYNKKLLQSLKYKRNQETFNRFFVFSRYKINYAIIDLGKTWFFTRNYSGDFIKSQLTALTIKIFLYNICFV